MERTHTTSVQICGNLRGEKIGFSTRFQTRGRRAEVEWRVPITVPNLVRTKLCEAPTLQIGPRFILAFVFWSSLGASWCGHHFWGRFAVAFAASRGHDRGGGAGRRRSGNSLASGRRSVAG